MTPPARHCPTCGRPLSATARFCEGCGTQVASHDTTRISPAPDTGADAPSGGGPPRWLLGFAIGFVAVAAVVGGVFVLGANTDDAVSPVASAPEETSAPTTATRATTPAPRPASRVFADPAARLASSAAATATVLQGAGGEEDLAGVVRVARRQLTLVNRVRAQVVTLPVADDPALTRSRGLLLAALSAHGRYLGQVVRVATTSPPGSAPLDALQRRALATRDAYRAFFAATPGVGDGVTGSGMGDLAGLRAAVADANTVEAPARPEPPQPGYGTVSNVRVGTHAGYDRVVFDIDGPVPAYRVIPSSFGYEVRIDGASAPYAPRTVSPGFTRLREVQQSGDTPVYLVRTSGGGGFRDFTLTGPNRIVVDVFH